MLVQLDRVCPRELSQLGAAVEWDLLTQGKPGERAIHRSGIQVAETEALRERPGDCALTGPSRAVDGDDHQGVEAVRSESSRSKKPGKLTATDSEPTISTPSREARPATAPSIAIR